MSQMLKHLKPNCTNILNVPPTMHKVQHPSPEWSALLLKLLKTGYFQETGYPSRSTQLGTNDIHLISTACLSFARDKYQLIRYLSPKHIFHLAGLGCPNTDRKIVDSGKRLRAHFNIDEENVCGSCILSGNCQRAFLRPHEGEGGRTVDVMRLLVAYALDPLTSSLEKNMPWNNKLVKESAKILLKEMVEFSRETIDSQPVKTAILRPNKENDWTCPKCNFRNFERNIKCLTCDHISQEKLTKQRGEKQSVPLKKGDWICEKCTFLNYAKNCRCLRCRENPPKRELGAGEWECESCNYINFRNNMACLKCDHRRPKAKNHVSKSSYPVSSNMFYQRTIPVSGEEKHGQEGGHTLSNFITSDNNTTEEHERLEEKCNHLVLFLSSKSPA